MRYVCHSSALSAAQQSQSKQNVAASRTKAISKGGYQILVKCGDRVHSAPRNNQRRALDLSFAGIIVLLDLCPVNRSGKSVNKSKNGPQS